MHTGLVVLHKCQLDRLCAIEAISGAGKCAAVHGETWALTESDNRNGLLHRKSQSSKEKRDVKYL